MYAAKQKASNQPSSPAVNFFRHFPTSFLRPYGRADPAPTEDVVMRRLSSINCEWLRRPQTGISEFADTIEANLNFLTENHSKFTKHSNFRAIWRRHVSSWHHYTVIKALLNDPQQHAAKSLETFCPPFTDFKSNPTVKGMKTLLTKTCCTSTAPAPKGRSNAKRNLAALLDSDDSDLEESPATASTTPALRRTVAPTASTSGTPTKKKSRKNKKNH